MLQIHGKFVIINKYIVFKLWIGRKRLLKIFRYTILIVNKILPSLSSFRCSNRWIFFFMTKIFNKPALNTTQALELLQKRGLVIPDLNQAHHYLTYIGYYRFMSYGQFFVKDRKSKLLVFVENTTFLQVIQLYEFDQRLRNLLLDQLSVIEVAVRAVISDHMAVKHGAHWFMQRDFFTNKFDHEGLLQRIKQETGFNKIPKGGHSPIFRKYYQDVQEPALPPSWMLTEGLSLGLWSTMYDFLSAHQDQKSIALKFALPAKVFSSWLQALTFLRNLCAHQAMVCYRHFHITPMKPHYFNKQLQLHFANTHALYPYLLVIEYLLKSIALHCKWRDQLKELLAEYEANLTVMGFVNSWSSDWEQKSFWLCM